MSKKILALGAVIGLGASGFSVTALATPSESVSASDSSQSICRRSPNGLVKCEYVGIDEDGNQVY